MCIILINNLIMQVKRKDCENTWLSGGRMPGFREHMVPAFVGSFTPVQSERPSDWCKWSEKPRRHDARILGGPKPAFGDGTPSLNSHRTDSWGIGCGSALEYIKASTAEGTLKLPRQDQEVAWNSFLPDCEDINSLTHRPDTRLQHPPSRYFP